MAHRIYIGLANVTIPEHKGSFLSIRATGNKSTLEKWEPTAARSKTAKVNWKKTFASYSTYKSFCLRHGYVPRLEEEIMENAKI